MTRDRKAPAPSPDDLAEKECIDAAVSEAVKMLKPIVDANKARTINSLTKAELTSVVWGAISKWIVVRSEIESRLGDTIDNALNDPIDDLWR